MAGVDYRQIQGPAQVQTDLPDDGAAARAAALGSLFKEFEGISADEYTKVQTQAGALAGAAAGATGHPQYREGLKRFTAYSTAFNNAATGAYAVQAQAQADDAAARLRVSANNDPATFQTTFTAVRDSVLKSAPAQAVPMLTELYNKHLAQGIGAVAGAQAEEQRNLQKQTYDAGVANQTSRVAALMSTGDPHDHLEALDEQAKLHLMIEGGKNTGLYSVAEAEAMQVNAMHTITSQVFSIQVDRELANPDGNVVLLMDNFRAAHIANLSDKTQPPILSEPEFQKLFADASTKIREWKITQDLMRSGVKTAQQIKWEQSDITFTAAFLQGRLTDRQLASATATGDLKPETARSLHNMLQMGVVGKSDPGAYLKAFTDPHLPSMGPVDIAKLTDISNPDKIKLGVEAERQRNNWEGTEMGKQGKAAIDAALKIAPGTPVAALSDAQVHARTDAQQEFTNSMNATDPGQRTAMAPQLAQVAVAHAKKREVLSEIDGLQKAQQHTLKNHGPGSPDEWSSEKLKAYQQRRADDIKALQAQLQGK